MVGALREASPGLPVLLERDAGAVEAGKVRLVQVLLPMPPPPGPLAGQWQTWRRVRGIPVGVGLPAPEVLAPFVAVFEITCGILILLGLLTRLAANAF